MLRQLSILVIFFTACIIMTTSLLSFLGCGSSDAEGNKDDNKTASQQENVKDSFQVALTKAQAESIDVRLEKTEYRSLNKLLYVSGAIEVPPQHENTISAPMGGFVRKVNVLQGERVKKGQLILVIENADYLTLQQDYLQTKNKLTYLEEEYNRQKLLSEEKVSSKKMFQKTSQVYLNAKVQLKALEEKLAMIGVNASKLDETRISRFSYIYSPVHGYVTEVSTNLGVFARPTDVLLKISDVNHLHVELFVYENIISLISIGQSVKVKLASTPDKEKKATVYLIGKKIQDDRTVKVHAHLEDEKDPDLIPGSYLHATIQVRQTKSMTVPSSAVVEFENKHYIYIDKRMDLDGNQYLFDMIEVTTGTSEQDYTQISLKEYPHADTTQLSVVSKGAFSLLSKMKNSEEMGHAH